MPSNRSKRLAAKRAREREAMEEHDQETETEQQTGEQDDHENDSTAEAKRTGIKTEIAVHPVTVTAAVEIVTGAAGVKETTVTLKESQELQ